MRKISKGSKIRKLIFLSIICLILTNRASADLIPNNETDWSNLEKCVVESVIWENYWMGRWKKGIYWKTDQIDVFLKKDSFEAMLVPSGNGKSLDVYIDELRSILFISKESGLYCLNGVSDSWSDNVTANEYFEYKKINEKNSKKHKFFIKSNYLMKSKLTPDKKRNIENLFYESILGTEIMGMINGKIKNKNQKYLEIKIGSFWNDFPCLYYIVPQIPDHYGWVVYNPLTYQYIWDNYLSVYTTADNEHGKYLFKKINELGDSFKLSLSKLNDPNINHPSNVVP